MTYRKPKGTLDILPGESYIWLYAEEIMRNAAKLYGFRHIRVPTFENTALFSRVL
jgi:histidyl-tRNA synthetase